MGARKHKRIAVDDPLAGLRAAMKRLSPEQGTVARRNARADVLSEARKLRAFVDREYPAISKTTTRRRKRRTGKQIDADLRRAGWRAASDTRVALFAAAGVPVKHTTWKANIGNDEMRVDSILVPGWAVVVTELFARKHWSARLREALNDKQARAAFEAEHALAKLVGDA